MNLQFNQQREQLESKAESADEARSGLHLPGERLNARAFAQFPNTVQGFEPAALDWLMAMKLTPEQRRHLLSRLQRPDYPNLVKLVVDDLNYTNSGGFGQFEIHRRLLLVATRRVPEAQARLLHAAELRQCLSCCGLHPSDDVNWRQDPAAMRAYLERLWDFVKTLDPAHNSLKAHVLYQRLVFDRSQGKYDLERFLEYLKLPKNMVYISPQFMEPIERQQHGRQLAAGLFAADDAAARRRRRAAGAELS